MGKVQQRLEHRKGRQGALPWNTVAVVAFAFFIVVMGWIEITRPLGFRFSDLTGGIVTMDTMVRAGILTIVVVGLNLLMGYAGQASLGQAAF
jgi:ABC-type branched-subunit amino acid transport system permease subunit